MIVTSLDTATSLLAGITIFGILGNLAYETGQTDIQSVVKGGSGLAFISYPDAISKFVYVPQLFSVVFFIMLFILGIGTNVGLAMALVTVVKDKFKSISQIQAVLAISLFQFSVGLVYLTPVSLYIFDYYFLINLLLVFLLIGWSIHSKFN